MKLMIMRHGQAVMVADTDVARELTSEGRRQVASVASKMLEDSTLISKIIASPFVRAQQTAKIIHALYPLAEYLTLDLITPDDEPFEALMALEPLVQPNTLIVTHMPLIGRLSQLLCEGHSQHPQAAFTSQVNVLEGDLFGSGQFNQRLTYKP